MTRILFQGESITDGEHDRGRLDHPGTGYSLCVASWLGIEHPTWDIEYLNWGISSNRVRDLHHRWYPDGIALQPNIVSILIGINDIWRRYDSAATTDLASFRACYDAHLPATAQPGRHLILCDLFVLPMQAEQWRWREDLDSKIQVVRVLAQIYQAQYVLLNGLFTQTATHTSLWHWTTDGVHPTPAGHAL